MYRCLKCLRELTPEDISEVKTGRGGSEKLRCPYCSYLIFRKIRPDGVKIVKAR